MPSKTKKVKAAPPAQYSTDNIRKGFAVIGGLFILCTVFYLFVTFEVNVMAVRYGTRITKLEAQIVQQQTQIMSLMAQVKGN